MEMNFNVRLFLLAIGVVIIVGVLVDVLRRRPKNSYLAKHSLNDLVGLVKPTPLNALDLVSLSIVAKNRKGFAGKLLIEVFNKAKFHYGKMKIFHKHKNDDKHDSILFSIAKVKEPGVFDLAAMAEEENIMGITLFYKNSKTKDPNTTLDYLFSEIKILNKTLNGQILDHEYKPISVQDLYRYKKMLQQVEAT